MSKFKQLLLLPLFLYTLIKYSTNNRILRVLSVHEPKAVRCPSSVDRPSVINFSHFRILLWNRWTEFNETRYEARSQRPLPSLCFWDWLEKQDGRPSLWLAEAVSTSPLTPLNEIKRHLTGSKISTSSIKFVFFEMANQDGHPSLWLAEAVSTYEIQRNLTGSKISASSTNFVFLGLSENQDGCSGIWLV